MLRSVLISALAVGSVLGASATTAQAEIAGAPTAQPRANDVSSEDFTPPAPPTYEANGVTVEEHLGALVPLDATFRTEDGRTVTLGSLMTGELPTILTFNYSDCPMLCTLQLNGLSAALPKLAQPVAASTVPGAIGDPDDDKDVSFRIGGQFRVITIDLEPRESLEKLAAMKERYIERLPEADRELARSGWTFLAAERPGDSVDIARVAATVGFKYTYITERAEWAHPAALIFLSARGAVTRYVYGIDFPAEMMRESIIKAGLAEQQTAVGFMNRCYHFDPDANNYSRGAVIALRVAAAGFLVVLVIGLGAYVRRRREVEA